MELKTIESKNKIFTLLVEIKKFNDENVFNLGKPDLFSTDDQGDKNKRAISLLIQLIKEMGISKEEIRQTVLLALPTIGLPSTMAAMSWVDDLLEKK